jgi:hypothetical protein
VTEQGGILRQDGKPLNMGTTPKFEIKNHPILL